MTYQCGGVGPLFCTLGVPGAARRYIKKGVRPFRYENVWQTHIDHERLVTETWRQSQREPGLQGVADSLGELQRRLEPWGAKEFDCLARTVRQLQHRLDRLRRQSVGWGPSEEEKKTVIKA